VKLAEAMKGLPKPKKMKPADFKEEVRRSLEEEVQRGRAVMAASGTVEMCEGCGALLYAGE